MHAIACKGIRAGSEGVVIGVDLVQRGPNDKHVCIQIMTEDDGYWRASDVKLSSSWIDHLLDVLHQAKGELEKLPDDPTGYGKVFR